MKRRFRRLARMLHYANVNNDNTGAYALRIEMLYTLRG